MKKLMFLVTVALLSAIMFSCKKDDGGNTPSPVFSDGLYLFGFSQDKTGIATTIGNGSGSQSTFDVASEFAGSDLAAKATDIVGVRFYVAEGAESGVAYVANELGTRIYEQAFTVEDPGWQYLLFSEVVEVRGDLTYYVGYEITGTGYFIGCNKVAGKDVYTHLLDDEEWTTFKAVGLTSYTLALQAICQGGDYSGEKQHDYAISQCSFPENVRVGDKVDFDVTVMSLGVQATGTVKVKCVCGPDELEKEVSNLFNGESVTLDFTLEGVSASMKKVEVTVSEVGVSTTATKSFTVNVYAADAPERNRILIEEFTGQACPNCPSGIATMRAAIQGMTNPDKAAWIAHHSGYYDDDFTLQGDKDIASAYGVSAAPMCMIDRMKVNYGSGTELVWHPGYATSALLNNLAAIPANATLTMNVSFTADSTIQVSISGKSLQTTAYATIVLCQNGIIASQSNGGSNYQHNEVVRAYLTASKGDELTLDADGNYTLTATYTIPAKISNYTSTKSFATDIQNMYVVAFVHGKASSKGAVYNADLVELKDINR